MSTLVRRCRQASVILGGAAAIAALSIGSASAASTGSPGQPSQTCGVTTGPGTPGSSVSAPGSAFNPDGLAGTVYAGNGAHNANNPKSVSQYDVACFQISPLAP